LTDGVRRTAVVQLLNRKRFVNTLGVAGLGLGLLASAVGAPSAMAQENQSQGIDRQLFQYEEGTLDLSEEELKQLLIQLLQEKVGEDGRVLAFRGDEDGKDVVIRRLQDGKDGMSPADIEEKRVEAYNEFTQALADELGIDDPDEVDAAIRIAMMSVVDSNVGLTEDTAEWQKALIATADVPIGPAYRGHGG
jgi:hypothetical protein